jgi:hypothetical protein
MENSEQTSISIRLSPTQVDEVVRAASQSRTPSISMQIANALGGQPAPKNGAPKNGAQSSKNGVQSSPKNRARSSSSRTDARKGPRHGAYPAIDSADPRLSRSLLRGLSLLTRFGPKGEARGIVELAHDVGMSPSTTHRYAATLVAFGLLEQCPKSRKYRLPLA